MTDVEVEPENPDNGVIIFEVATMPNDVLDPTSLMVLRMRRCKA